MAASMPENRSSMERRVRPSYIPTMILPARKRRAMLAIDPISPDKKVRAIQRLAPGANFRIRLSIKPSMFSFFAAALLLRHKIKSCRDTLVNKSVVGDIINSYYYPVLSNFFDFAYAVQ